MVAKSGDSVKRNSRFLRENFSFCRFCPAGEENFCTGGKGNLWQSAAKNAILSQKWKNRSGSA